MKVFSKQILAGLAAMAAIAGNAFGGEKTGQEVVFSAVKAWATGDLGYVRNTPDTLQYMSCTISGTLGSCVARNSAGVIHSCTTSDPDIVSGMHALNGDSYLTFAWNTDGTCKVVQVRNDSRSPPK